MTLSLPSTRTNEKDGAEHKRLSVAAIRSYRHKFANIASTTTTPFNRERKRKYNGGFLQARSGYGLERENYEAAQRAHGKNNGKTRPFGGGRCCTNIA